MARLLSLLPLTAAIAGCALPPVGPSPNPNWTRVSGNVAGCVSYGPRRREVVDLNIVLKPEFEEALLAQVVGTDRNAPKCWYETHSGSIRMFAGDFCGDGMNFYFEQQASAWRLDRTDKALSFCHPIKQ